MIKLKTLLQEIIVTSKNDFMLRNLDMYIATVTQPLYLPFKYNISGEEEGYNLIPGEAINVFKSKTDGWYVLSSIAAQMSLELEDRVYIISATYLTNIEYDPGASKRYAGNPSDPGYLERLKLLNTIIFRSRLIFLEPARS